MKIYSEKINKRGVIKVLEIGEEIGFNLNFFNPVVIRNSAYLYGYETGRKYSTKRNKNENIFIVTRLS